MSSPGRALALRDERRQSDALGRTQNGPIRQEGLMQGAPCSFALRALEGPAAW